MNLAAEIHGPTLIRHGATHSKSSKSKAYDTNMYNPRSASPSMPVGRAARGEREASRERTVVAAVDSQKRRGERRKGKWCAWLISLYNAEVGSE